MLGTYFQIQMRALGWTGLHGAREHRHLVRAREVQRRVEGGAVHGVALVRRVEAWGGRQPLTCIWAEHEWPLRLVAGETYGILCTPVSMESTVRAHTLFGAAGKRLCIPLHPKLLELSPG